MRVRQDTVYAKAWREIEKQAETKLKRCDIADVDYLSLAYLMTEDTRYAAKVKEILLSLIGGETKSSSEMRARFPAWRSDLGLAHKAFMAAIGYDAIYNEMSKTERKQIAEGLSRVAMEPCLGDWLIEPTRIHSLNSMGHNWWTSCACMGGVLAISLQNELDEAKAGAEAMKEYLPEWFDFSGDVLQHKPKTFDAAGGMYESLNYANFGIQESLLFLLAWKQAYPNKAMPDIPQLKLLPAFFAHVCYPRTGILYSINFGDSHKNVAAESSLMLLDALGETGPTTLWYISHVEQGQHRDGYFLNRPIGFLYTPDLNKAPNEPRLNKSQLYSDFGWATIRDSWKKNSTMLAVKSGQTWNHSHADANSFILFHKGVDIIKDAGNCWYPRKEYRDYFFQSEAHNVVLFNGNGQPREQQYKGAPLRGYLHYLMDAGNLRYVLADGTGPYSDQFSRNYRHFLWLDNVIYIVDDLKTHEVGHFEWLWHTNGEVKKQGGDVNVTNGESAITIRPIYPRALAQSDFVHDYPDDLYWESKEGPTEDLKGTETYYSFHLPAKVDRVKGVTAIILKNGPDDRNVPEIETREGKNWIGLRIRNGRKITDLYINQLSDGRLMHSNSWLVDVDGWTTDAYMFAVTYNEGDREENTKDLFVCYGSALRRGECTYFSSLSKLFVIQQMTGGQLELNIQGQDKVHAHFGHLSRPTSVSVNGKLMRVDYDKVRSEINVKYDVNK